MPAGPLPGTCPRNLTKLTVVTANPVILLYTVLIYGENLSKNVPM
jgi:hypothetical protein